MPRFGTKSLLICFAVVGLWLSTFSAYTGSNDVQAFIWTAIIVTSGIAALSHTGRRRAFWIGFFGTMLLNSSGTIFNRTGANLQWTHKLSRTLAEQLQVDQLRSGRLVLNINSTLILIVLLAAAMLIGLLCVYVYDQSRKTEISRET
jgi:hypothetical protein